MHDVGYAGDTAVYRVQAPCFHGGHIHGKGRGIEKISENSEEGSIVTTMMAGGVHVSEKVLWVGVCIVPQI